MKWTVITGLSVLLVMVILAHNRIRVGIHYIQSRMAGQKTISDRVEEYGAAVSARLIPRFIAAGIHFPPQPEPKRNDLQKLHDIIRGMMPDGKLWFLDGRDESGRTVSNPSIGYGVQAIKYADGRTKDFYQIGISANTAGISVYIMGLKDKKYLAKTYGKKLGKAGVIGYCITFRTLEHIDVDTLVDAMRYGVEQTRA